MSRPSREIAIVLNPLTGAFAEDKDAAAAVREGQIRPALAARQRIVLDFKGVRVATQSFLHALISDVLRTAGEDVLDRITFTHCTTAVRGIIQTVVQYSLESIETDEPNGKPKLGTLERVVPPRRKNRIVKETIRRKK